jgi:hypothetical protein
MTKSDEVMKQWDTAGSDPAEGPWRFQASRHDPNSVCVPKSVFSKRIFNIALIGSTGRTVNDHVLKISGMRF